MSKFTPTECVRLALGTLVKLARAEESVSSRLRPGILNAGLTESQFGVLEVIYFKGPLCQRAIGEKILKTSGNITMVIDNLEKRHLVRRERSSEDRRHVTIYLTEQGEALIHEIFPGHAAEVRNIMQALTEDEQRELGRLCRKLGKQES
ncbi:MAG: MarR family winged helix-turn-helix transcriptional regulator [Capsulimonas sp.]|uniref:MarR family winged helix-turn-helix transcriptional regulator n=1 Tax=Capsulimonas sp. TaxID=2494211 RepID=UPI0032654FBA